MRITKINDLVWCNHNNNITQQNVHKINSDLSVEINLVRPGLEETVGPNVSRNIYAGGTFKYIDDLNDMKSHGRFWHEGVDFRKSGPGPKFGFAEASRERKSNLSPDHIRRTRIPMSVFGANTSGIQDREVRKIIKLYISDIPDRVYRGQGLIISGKCGVGKTIASAMLAVEAAKWGFSVLYMVHGDLQEAQFEDKPDIDGELIKNKLKSVDLLIMDSMDETFLVDARFGPIQCERLISSRNDAKKSTVFTTRMTPSILKSKCSTLFSVMQGNMNGIVLDGVDLRALAAAERLKVR